MSRPSSPNFSPLWQLTLARWRSFYREPSTIFWAFVFPIVLAFALGVAFRNRPPEPVWAAVLQGEGAPAVFGALERSGQVKVQVYDERGAHEALRTGKVALVVVPATATGPRTYQFDPTRPDSRLARAVVDDILQRAEGRVDPTKVADFKVDAPGSRYIDFLVPGLLGLNLMSSGMWGIGFVLVEMRTRKLIKRLLATPMKKRDFLFAFGAMRGLFLLGELPLLIGFTWLVFHVAVKGSLLLLLGCATLGSLTFAGLGLLTASRAQNTQTANGLINLVQMPMFLCSGVFFSSERFPEVLQPVIKALPLTALNDALRGIMIDGAGLAQVARPMAIVAAWGVGAFLIALKLFRWR
ncbi:MAG: Transport permease protein [Myxococcales bacterium]|nr:Transport permease protein [Myxococcales bacterium]